MQNRPFVFGPLALTTTYTTNILNPGTTTGGVNATASPYDKERIILTHIRVVNKTGTAATFRLFRGATGANAAGTELAYDQSVAPYSAWEWGGRMALDTVDYLVGGASAATTLTIQGEGEIGIA